MLVSPSYISVLINLIVQTYHYDATSVCVLWNDNFPYYLQQSNSKNYAAIASLFKPAFNEEADIPLDRLDLLTNFEAKLTEYIQQSHCESYVAFEEEISFFVKSFTKSVLHSKWRSAKNKYLFVYTRDRSNVTSTFNHTFFKVKCLKKQLLQQKVSLTDQANILFVEIVNETLFELKTTKFVGSRKSHPEELLFLDRYSAETETFEFNQNLYPDKLKDLMGREVIVATLTYAPFGILKNATVTNVMDVGHGNEDPSKRLFYDGMDAQFVFNFCWLYNCTVQVDSSENEVWGFVYENYTANGLLGLVFDKKADIAMLAMYMWYENYIHFDMSSVLSRSGVTCLVPAPRRVISWLLPFNPFQWLLWLGIVGCLILEAVGLLVTRRVDRTENISWKDSAYFGYVTSLKVFVSQGSNFLPSSVSVRIVLFSCYMIDIIITSIYSGGLASILTIPSLEEVADSFDRLAKYNLIWSGAVPNWLLSIQGSDEERTKRIINNFRVYSAIELKKNREFAKSIGYATERLEFGHFALPDYLDQDIMDSLKIMIDDIYYMYCVAFVPRSWALLEKFNNVLLLMHSNGLIQHLEWKVVADNLNTSLQKQMEASVKINFEEFGPVKLGMENFAGIIIILLVGLILSIIVFIVELLHYRFRSMDM